MVDFVIVPTVFRNLPDVMQAGNLGVILFNKYNMLEFLLALILVPVFIKMPTHKSKKLIGIGVFLLLAIAGSYLFYLTPKLTELTSLMGQGGEVAQEHSFYHSLYVKIDSIKLIILLALQGVVLIRKEKV